MASKFLVKNMGGVDRALRAFVIAPLAIVAALSLGVSSIAGLVLFILAGVALVTGATGICPSYVPFGIDTHRRGRAHAPLRTEPDTSPRRNHQRERTVGT